MAGDRLYPVRVIDASAEPSRVAEVLAAVDAGLRERKLRQIPFRTKAERPSAAVYEKGSTISKVASAVIGVVVESGSSANLNLHYYVVLEATADARVIVAVHGHDTIMMGSLQDGLEPVFASVAEALPFVRVEPWSSGIGLPKDLVASPKGFRKALGTGKWFLWS